MSHLQPSLHERKTSRKPLSGSESLPAVSTYMHVHGCGADLWNSLVSEPDGNPSAPTAFAVRITHRPVQLIPGGKTRPSTTTVHACRRRCPPRLHGPRAKRSTRFAASANDTRPELAWPTKARRARISVGYVECRTVGILRRASSVVELLFTRGRWDQGRQLHWRGHSLAGDC